MSNPQKMIQQSKTLTAPSEPKPLIENASLVTMPAAGAPSPREIQSALETLTALQLSGASGRIPVEPGDIVFFYEFKMVAYGQDVYTLRGMREIKESLTESGIASAPEAVEQALLELIRPLKNRAMRWINDFLESFTH